MLQRRPKNLRLNEYERNMMRAACRFNAQLHDFLRTQIRPGLTTREIDRLVYKYTRDHGHVPAPLGYRGQKGAFPASCCTSVNDVICHGIPGDYILRDGDIINVDCTTIVNGWHGDSSETYIVGAPSDTARKVVQAAHDAMWLAIRAIKPNSRISEIGDAIVAHAHSLGYSVVEEYVGHGVGRQFHQPPTIPHAPTDESRRQKLEVGTCFTIEPMINTGVKDAMSSKRDGWTVRTKDGGLSAQFEHSVLMTETGPEVLTLTKNGPQEGHVF
jgi:methionyl aminopeptidase